MKTALLCLLLALPLTALPLTARAETGYVNLPSGHAVYADYTPARPGRPTVVLVNGLVYDFGRWRELARPLAESGYGILRYNFRGQGKTLRKELETGEPAFFREGLSREDLSQELNELLAALKIKKAVVVGLSYGAAIAAEFARAHPEKTEALLFLAPLVVPIDRYSPGGAWTHQSLEALRFFWGPLWGPYVYDYYYNLIYRSYLQQRLVPERIPEEMQDMKDAYKESIFHLVRATRDFDLRDYRFPALAGKVHFLLASDEEEPALRDQFQSWRNFGAARGLLAYLTPASHAIPDTSGEFAAGIIQLILERNLQGVFYAPTAREPGEMEPMSLEELEARTR